MSEVAENAYPVLKTDTAVCTYFLDSPGILYWATKSVLCTLYFVLVLPATLYIYIYLHCLPLSAGLVPLGETRGPKFAFDVVLGANTVVNYGCYANRQR